MSPIKKPVFPDAGAVPYPLRGHFRRVCSPLPPLIPLERLEKVPLSPDRIPAWTGQTIHPTFGRSQ